MKHLRIAMLAGALLIGTITLVPGAWCGQQPDFNNPDAVLQDIRAKIDQCTEASSRDCMVKCGYAIRTLQNFIKANPGGDPSIFEQRWQPCFEAHRDANLPVIPVAADSPEPLPAETPATPKTTEQALDRSRFVISGLQMGGDMNSQRDRFFLLEAHGYHEHNKSEHKVLLLGTGATKPEPNIIQNYFGTIREAPVYIHFEATADGTVYMIQFEQKEDMDQKAVGAALVERFGQPTRYQGNYLIWGCDRGPEKGLCVKANVSPRSMTIWALDGDLKAEAHKEYRENVLEAKGIKGGAKF